MRKEVGVWDRKLVLDLRCFKVRASIGPVHRCLPSAKPAHLLGLAERPSSQSLTIDPSMGFLDDDNQEKGREPTSKLPIPSAMLTSPQKGILIGKVSAHATQPSGINTGRDKKEASRAMTRAVATRKAERARRACTSDGSDEAGDVIAGKAGVESEGEVGVVIVSSIACLP